MDNKNFTGEAVIGMNDHPSLTFSFDTANFHSPDTKWFLEAIEWDGCTKDCPMSFYQDIIDFCERRIKQIPHYDVVDGVLEWNDERE